MGYRYSVMMIGFEQGVFDTERFMDFIQNQGFGCYSCHAEGSTVYVGDGTTRVCPMDMRLILNELEKYEGVSEIRL